MAAKERDTIELERSVAHVLLRWLPAITAIIAAVATILVALFSWNASRSATDKDYVSLAMSILSAKDSSLPSRRWAVDILSRTSPVPIPKELASGLVTGHSVMPSELDPTATRNEIMSCLNPVLKSDLVKPVEGAPLPPKNMKVGDIMAFGIQQTGQLDIANLKINALREAIDTCIPPRTAK